MADAINNLLNLASLGANPDYDFVKLCANNAQDDNFFSIQGDSPYDLNKFNCVYSSPLDYKVDVTSDNLVLMSSNLQSINSKFGDLCELVSTLASNNSDPDVICLQELWQFPNDTDFSLPGYHKLIYKLRRNNVQGGGVLAFLLNRI